MLYNESISKLVLNKITYVHCGDPMSMYPNKENRKEVIHLGKISIKRLSFSKFRAIVVYQGEKCFCVDIDFPRKGRFGIFSFIDTCSLINSSKKRNQPPKGHLILC